MIWNLLSCIQYIHHWLSESPSTTLPTQPHRTTISPQVSLFSLLRSLFLFSLLSYLLPKTRAADIDLASLTASQGFRILGAAADDRSGFSVVNAGDVNDDGFADILIGAPFSDPNGRLNAGTSYLIYGAVNLSVIDLANLATYQGFQILGAMAGDQSGFSVASAGDINNDSFDDILIGAPYASPNARSNAGISYIIYGGANITALDLNSFTSIQGVRIIGAIATDQSGYSVAGVGDVNDDGFADILVGAYKNDPKGRTDAGTSYLIYGGNNLSDIDLISINMTQGFRIFGAMAGDQSGFSVASAGDINHDSFDDILIGAYKADPNSKTNAGISYLIYGASSLSDIDLANFTITQGFSLFGATAGDQSGWSVAGSGDVNNDGFMDILIGAYSSDPNGRADAGTSYVIYGGDSLFDIDFANLTTRQGFKILGASANDWSGFSVAGAGDVNHDGFADILIGAYRADPNGKTDAGIAYLIYGGRNVSDVDCINFNTTQGFSIWGATANDRTGMSVTTAGDINNDGFSDILIGVRFADPNGRVDAGLSYIIYGSAFTSQPTISPTFAPSTLPSWPPTFIPSITPTQPTRLPTLMPTVGAQGTEFQVNSYTVGEQRNPSIASLSNGGFVVVWESNGQDGDGYGIYGQRYTWLGVKDGSEFRVNTYTTGNQDIPRIASLSNSGFVVVWQSDGQDGSGYGIYGQRYTSLGLADGGEFRVNTYITGNQGYSSITSLGNGGFVVVWQSNGQDGSGLGIYAQRYTSTGAGDGSEFRVNTYATSDQIWPTVTSLNNGSFVVVWQSYGQDGSSWGIYGQRYTSLGGADGSEFQVNTYITNDQQRPWSTSLNNGGFVVVWHSLGQDGSSWGIYGQRYTSLGAADGSEFRINAYTLLDQIYPSITGLITGGFVVVWYSNLQDSSNYGVYGQRYTSMGAVDGSEFLANTYTTNGQISPSITGLSNGGFVVVWVSDGQDGSNWGVYGQRYDVSGNAIALILPDPTVSPTSQPTFFPTVIPTFFPTSLPTTSPSVSPTINPTRSPTFLSSTVIDLASLTATQGFRIFGVSANDRSGACVASAGDVNGDGFSDILIGALKADPNGKTDAGASYLVYGGASLTTTNLASLITTQGFSVLGAAAGDISGYSVSSAGDVNGDGFSDILIGTWKAAPNGKTDAGTSYLIYGGLSLSNVDLASLTSTQGFTILGAATNDQSGYVTSAGDVNKDGFADILIGALYAAPNGRSGAGTSYVIYGGASLATIDLASLTASQGFRILGAAAWDLSGGSVAPAGDVNKDGFADILIGALFADPNGRDAAGTSYVIYGGASLATVDLASLSSTQGFRILGAIAGDSIGNSVASAGDVNHDGFDDIVIGAWRADPNGRTNAGTSYVIYGGSSLSTIDLASLTSTQGFSILGAAMNDHSGFSVAGAGDVNKDGFDDILIGARYADPNGRTDAGTSYVIYGSTSLTTIDLASLTTAQGFRILGASAYGESGWSVAGAGDVNNDGFADILIGAHWANSAGTSYIIYGGAFTSRQPSISPTFSPSVLPSCFPTNDPTFLPTSIPTVMPTHGPTSLPTVMPSSWPTQFPSFAPSQQPTVFPSALPTTEPSLIPSVIPTYLPSGEPTFLPTVIPTTMPTLNPSSLPTHWPSCLPTDNPSLQPTLIPTILPSGQPTFMPTVMPTGFPSFSPTDMPTTWPTCLPTNSPSFTPTLSPTMMPSGKPSLVPTLIPTDWPTNPPSLPPTEWPTDFPSPSPSYSPTWIPTNHPSGKPSWTPTWVPTTIPTDMPLFSETMLNTYQQDQTLMSALIANQTMIRQKQVASLESRIYDQQNISQRRFENVSHDISTFHHQLKMISMFNTSSLLDQWLIASILELQDTMQKKNESNAALQEKLQKKHQQCRHEHEALSMQLYVLTQAMQQQVFALNASIHRYINDSDQAFSALSEDIEGFIFTKDQALHATDGDINQELARTNSSIHEEMERLWLRLQQNVSATASLVTDASHAEFNALQAMLDKIRPANSTKRYAIPAKVITRVLTENTAKIAVLDHPTVQATRRWLDRFVSTKDTMLMLIAVFNFLFLVQGMTAIQSLRYRYQLKEKEALDSLRQGSIGPIYLDFYLFIRRLETMIVSGNLTKKESLDRLAILARIQHMHHRSVSLFSSLETHHEWKALLQDAQELCAAGLVREVDLSRKMVADHVIACISAWRRVSHIRVLIYHVLQPYMAHVTGDDSEVLRGPEHWVSRHEHRAKVAAHWQLFQAQLSTMRRPERLTPSTILLKMHLEFDQQSMPAFSRYVHTLHTSLALLSYLPDLVADLAPAVIEYHDQAQACLDDARALMKDIHNITPKPRPYWDIRRYATLWADPNSRARQGVAHRVQRLFQSVTEQIDHSLPLLSAWMNAYVSIATHAEALLDKHLRLLALRINEMREEAAEYHEKYDEIMDVLSTDTTLPGVIDLVYLSGYLERRFNHDQVSMRASRRRVAPVPHEDVEAKSSDSESDHSLMSMVSIPSSSSEDMNEALKKMMQKIWDEPCSSSSDYDDQKISVEIRPVSMV